jgi:hypothetical protein
MRQPWPMTAACWWACRRVWRPLYVIGTLFIGIYPRPFVAPGKKATTSLHIPAQNLGKQVEVPNLCRDADRYSAK